ncbi:MAG: YbaB/EbfC family nucleoid-associated protein [Firmicutes bacterium]|nr:YbaB/EbfC family nucleoid-associated protein [Bacillota bacterium]MCL2771328.1 YbaB/EbfC family nucleoid-associated protein [Bacillota bacterium]
MFGGQNMQQLMRQAQQMQAEMGKIQAEVDATEISTSAGGGLVTVTILGNKTIKGIKIKPEAVDPDDAELLEDLIVAALNDAFARADELKASKMGKFGNMPF